MQAGQHVLFELGDHLGSSAVVLDHDTGELVERSSFYAYGATEGDYRPEQVEGVPGGLQVHGQGRGRRGRAHVLRQAVSESVPREVGECGSAGSAWLGSGPEPVCVRRRAVLKNVDPVGLGDEGEMIPVGSHPIRKAER